MRYEDLTLQEFAKIGIVATLIFILIALALVFPSLFAPLIGAAIFAGLLGYGFLTGAMPTKYGPELDRREAPAMFWTLGSIYAAGSVVCLIWFMVVLLS